jgi:hypothetical protein
MNSDNELTFKMNRKRAWSAVGMGVMLAEDILVVVNLYHSRSARPYFIHHVEASKPCLDVITIRFYLSFFSALVM